MVDQIPEGLASFLTLTLLANTLSLLFADPIGPVAPPPGWLLL